MSSDAEVRKQLVALLTVRQAHMSFEDAITDFPLEQINVKPPNTDYTVWHLLEHLRITQWDILDYIRNPGYQYRTWPEGYWPAPDARAEVTDWNRTIEQFQADRQALVDIINDPQTDVYAQIPHGQPGHTIIREIEVIGAHNAYHIGELGILRQVMGLWPERE